MTRATWTSLSTSSPPRMLDTRVRVEPAESGPRRLPPREMTHPRSNPWRLPRREESR